MHRGQLTFDYIDRDTGENRRGRIVPADRLGVGDWLTQFDGGRVELALEGCTGWRFRVEECQGAGVAVHLADRAEVAESRGTKGRAKADRLDGKRLRRLLEKGEVPESWIPPTFVPEIRTKAPLCKDLIVEKKAWQQRIHATLFHQGVPKVDDKLWRKDRAQHARDDPPSPTYAGRR